MFYSGSLAKMLSELEQNVWQIIGDIKAQVPSFSLVGLTVTLLTPDSLPRNI